MLCCGREMHLGNNVPLILGPYLMEKILLLPQVEHKILDQISSLLQQFF